MLQIEQFITAEAALAFRTRQQHAIEAIGILSIDGSVYGEPPATVFGGAGFAMQGLDTHLPGGKPFDLDTVVPPEMFVRLRQEKRFSGGVRRTTKGLYMGTVPPSAGMPLSVDVLTADGSNPQALDRYLTVNLSEGTVMLPTHEVAGVQVVEAPGAALSKIGGSVPRVKDAGGLLKAHFIGEYNQHPTTTIKGWRAAIALARKVAISGAVEKPLLRSLFRMRPNYPSWLDELVDKGFDHPAFSDLPDCTF